MKILIQKGFSLVEMMIVIAVLMILFVGVFGSSYVFREQLQFKAAYEKVIGTIHEARSLALSSQSFPDTSDYDGDGLNETNGDKILPYGYIINFDLTNPIIVVSIYADLFSSETGVLEKGIGGDELIKTFELPENIKIISQGLNQVATPIDIPAAGITEFSLLYKTPGADFYILDNTGKNSIQLQLDQVDQSDTVKRTKYIFMQYFYGIPELMDTPIIANP